MSIEVNKLFEMNEDELSQYLQDEVDKIIARVPEERRQRLIGLQWRLDQIRKLNPDPTLRMVLMQEEMLKSLKSLQEAWISAKPKIEKIVRDTDK